MSLIILGFIVVSGTCQYNPRLFPSITSTLTEALVASGETVGFHTDPVMAGLVQAGTVPLLQLQVRLPQHTGGQQQQQQQHLPPSEIFTVISAHFEHCI